MRSRIAPTMLLRAAGGHLYIHVRVRELFSNNITMYTDEYYFYLCTCVSKKHEHKSIYGSAPWVSPCARPDVRCAMC